MKKIVPWILLLLVGVVGTAVAVKQYAAFQEAKRRIGELEGAAAVATARADSFQLVSEASQREAGIWRDSAGRAQVRYEQRGRALVRVRGDLDAYIAAHEQHLPEELRRLLAAERDSTNQVIAACDAGWEACKREALHLRDALRADSLALGQMRVATDSLRAALTVCKDAALSPRLTLPRFALKIGQYAEHAVALVGGACILKEWVFDGGGGSSPNDYGIVRPLDTRAVLTIRVYP